METIGTLSPNSKLHIREMLLTPQISESVYADVRKGKTYKCTEIQDDGTIYLGETSFKWVNTLFRLDKEISFETFVMRVFGAVAQMAGSETKDVKKIVVNGLSQDILASMIATKDINVVVDRLFDTLRFALKTSPMASKGTPRSKDYDPLEAIKHLHFEGGARVPVRDSVGRILLHVNFVPDSYTVSRD